MRYLRGPGHVVVGNLLVSWNVRMYGHEPVVDGCWTNLRLTEGNERFGGLAIRAPWRRRESTGVSLCWKGAEVPNVSARALVRWARWVLAGRPRPTVVDPQVRAAIDSVGPPRPAGLR